MATTPGTRTPLLPLVGLAVAVWAVLPPYSGPEINTGTRVEIVDHVVPAVLLVAVSLWALFASRRPGFKPGSGMLAAGLGVALAGMWMTATHVPLVAQANRDEVSNAAAAYHTAPGLAVLALGAVWAIRYWSAADAA